MERLLFARRTARLEFDEKLSSAVDYDWYFKHYLKGSLIHFISKPLARYRLHEKNTSKKLRQSTENVFRIFQKHDFQKTYEDLNKTANSSEVRISFAWYHVTLNEFDQALEKLSEIETENFERNFLEAVIFALKGDFTRAADRFRLICTQNPKHPEAFNNLAVCLVHSKNEIVEAKNLLLKATRINSELLRSKKQPPVTVNRLFRNTKISSNSKTT